MKNAAKTTILLIAAGVVTPVYSQDTIRSKSESRYLPEIHGTLRTKYEFETAIGRGRFEVRNARFSLEGNIIPILRYKAELDLSEEGSIKMKDAYLRIQPISPLRITVGQMRVPFTIDAHRSPHLQYFANRSFIAKQVGSVHDVGIAAAWTFGGKTPVTLEAGIFNGSGMTNQKDFWTDRYNFSIKLQTMIARQFNITLSCQKANIRDVKIMMYDAGTYWDNGRFHIEAEYLRKHYADGAFPAVNAADVFASYRVPLRKIFTGISFLCRYDYMSDHTSGGTDDNGNLTVDDPERHRITAGTTLSLGKKRLQADLRLNFEQYFYNKGTVPGISDQNKLVVELVAHF